MTNKKSSKLSLDEIRRKAKEVQALRNKINALCDELKDSGVIVKMPHQNQSHQHHLMDIEMVYSENLN